MARKRRKRAGDPETASGEGREVPRWVAPLLYAVVTLLLFRKFVFSDAMLEGGDTNALGYMARAFYADAVRNGTFPFWNPLILGGTPFIESLAGGDSLYPTALLLFVMEPYRALGWKLVIHVFLAGLFMFGWVRALGLSRAAALVAGLGYLMAPYLVTLVLPGHDGKIFVTALTPLLFWATEASLVRRGLLPLTGLAAVVGLVVLTTHFQMAYFLFGAVGVYAALRCVRIWRKGVESEEGDATATGDGPTGDDGDGVSPEAVTARTSSPGGAGAAVSRFALFLAASILGAGVAGVQLIPAVDYVTEYSRRTATTTEASAGEAAAYSSSWSLHPEEIVSLAVPEFVGNSGLESPWGRGTYWGRNPFKGNHEYVGIVVLLLALLGLFGNRRPWVRWSLVGLGVTALLYTLGAHTPVWHLFYALVPGVSLFRAPSIAIFLFGFVCATLAAFGVEEALASERSPRRRGPSTGLRALLVATGVLAVGTVLSASGVLRSLWLSLVYRDADPGRLQALETLAPYMTRGFVLATLLAAATGAVWWAYGRGYLRASGVLSVLCLLVFLDLVRIDDPFIRVQDFSRFHAPDAHETFLVEQASGGPPFRVLSMARSGQDVDPGMYGIELAAGHHPNDLARYRELIGMVGSGIPANFFDQSSGSFALNRNLLDLLDVHYLLWPNWQFGTPSGLEVVSELRLADGRPFTTLYRVGAAPRARLVGDVVVRGDEEAVETLLGPDFDPSRQVVLPEAPPVDLPGGTASGTIEWLERSPNELRLRVRSDGPALLVVGENWFPAWRATVNGAEQPVLRANHTLRAVPVGAGESEVRLRYHSEVLARSLLVSLVALTLLLIGAGIGFARARRDRVRRAS